MTKQVQYCRCRINLAGQNCHTVIYDEYNPVTWPEIQVLMQLHGEENVMDVVPVGVGEVWPTQEKNRLAGIYGSRIVEQCFPGRAFRMDYMMTDDVDLPKYVEGAISTRVAMPGNGNGDDDEDDGEDEVMKNPPLEPIFKPGRRGRPAAEASKEA